MVFEYLTMVKWHYLGVIIAEKCSTKLILYELLAKKEDQFNALKKKFEFAGTKI